LLANVVLEWWGTDRAAARVLPKTCPQGSARPSGDADFILFAASFKDLGRAHLVEALRVTEVLCPSGQEPDLQGVFGPLVDATRDPFLDLEDSLIVKIGRFAGI
jgi:hypothetical protein